MMDQELSTEAAAANSLPVKQAADNKFQQPLPRARRPHQSMRCASCGRSELSSLPAFSAGSGVATRPFAEDVICQRCGYIGMAALVS